MKYKQPILITCENQAQKTMALTLLYGLGYQYFGCKTLQDVFTEYEKDVYDTKFPDIYLDGNGEHNCIDMCSRYHAANDGSKIAFTDNEMLMKYLTRDMAPISIKLNDDYEAILCPDYIKVGCQKIFYSAFNTLAKAVKDYKG